MKKYFTNRAHLIPWLIIAGLAMLLIGCTFHKALVSSFTHDESFTWNHYVSASLADIFSYRIVSPNNHLLNTLLMKTGARLFGNSAIVLRFPNILAHLGFLVFTLLLLRKLNPWVILPLFALVNCNPYLLDFFGLARGNGLSYCFLMGSIYFFTRYADRHKTGYYLWSVTFAFLGVLSHFTMLYYFLSLVAVANLWPYLQRHITRDRENIMLTRYAAMNAVNLFFLLILCIIMSGPVLKLIAADQLFYGGSDGFWKNTVGTLIDTFFYGVRHGAALKIFLQILILAVVVSTMALLLFAMIKKNSRLFNENTMLFIVFLLLIFTVSINTSQFYLVGTKLLIRRYGLLFAPMFMLCLCLLFVAWSRSRNVRILPVFLMYSLAAAFSIHTFSAFSATTYLDWEYEKETANMITILENDVRLHTPPSKITLGISWPFEPTVNFYRVTRKLAWLNQANRDGPSIDANYYYIFRDDLPRVPLHGFLPVILFDDGKTVLVKVQRNR